MADVILGTANFGMDYGSSPQPRRLRYAVIEDILSFAIENRINKIDTAISYGQSEQVLGTVGISQFAVISKIQSLRSIVDKKEFVLRAVEQSCRRLRIDWLEGLLLHDPIDLEEPHFEEVCCALEYARDQGLIRRVGASLYNPNQYNPMGSPWKPDILQIPLNIFDRRFQNTQFLNSAFSRGIELHSRSLFLKGVLLKDPKSRDLYFSSWKSDFDRFEEYASSNGGKLEVCIKHANSILQCGSYVVGVSSVRQLKRIIEATKLEPLQAPVHLQIEDELLLDPRRWKLDNDTADFGSTKKEINRR